MAITEVDRWSIDKMLTVMKYCYLIYSTEQVILIRSGESPYLVIC